MPSPFLRNYALLKIPIVREDGQPAWPALFPEDEIQRLREVVGPRHFMSQMMMEFVAPERSRLDPGALTEYDMDFDAANARLGEILTSGYSAYWDPSSARRGADGSVVALVLFHQQTRRAFIHDVLYLRVGDNDTHPMATQAEQVLNFLQKHKIRHLGIEVNGLGNALPEILRGIAASRNQPITINRITSHRKKETRILEAFEPLLSTGRLFVSKSVMNGELIGEMQDWTPIGANMDDGIDAVAGALLAQPTATRTRAQLFTSRTANTDFTI
ncbi:MAG: hypothetical protein LBG89_01705 [Rickettsiales bacterium]|jgi:predicted phage terminase large subunit-like protein|nr:hypothetical protein [Rickettsiales bacterium]